MITREQLHSVENVFEEFRRLLCAATLPPKMQISHDELLHLIITLGDSVHRLLKEMKESL